MAGNETEGPENDEAGGNTPQPAPNPEPDQQYKLYAMPETLKHLGRYKEALLKYIPRIAGSNVIILTPNDFKESGVKLDAADKDWNSKMMQAVLERIPGLDYESRDIAALQAGGDYTCSAALGAMCSQAQRAYNNPSAQVYDNVLKDTLIIALPDTPQDVERMLSGELSGLPKDLLKGFPKASPMDWYFLVVLHEAAHGPQIRARQGKAEDAPEVYTSTHDKRFGQTEKAIGKLINETGADETALREYFNLRAAGVPLGWKTPELFEALRAISTLEHNGDFFTRDTLDGHLHDHATSPILDVLDDREVATEVFGTKEAALAALHVNTVANALMAKLEGRNRLWNWKPDPLERYAAVKFLHEKGYFAEGTAERVIAREYVDAFDSYIRTANSSKTVKDILKEAGSRPDMLQGLENKTGWRDLIEDHLYGTDHETPEPPETASAEKKAATPKPLLRR